MAHQARSIRKLHISRIVPSLRNTKILNIDRRYDAVQTETYVPQGILKDNRNDKNEPSHARYLEMSDNRFGSTGRLELEACQTMNHKDSEAYDNGKILRLMSIPIYQVYTQGTMPVSVDTRATIYRIGAKIIREIVHVASRNTIL